MEKVHQITADDPVAMRPDARLLDVLLARQVKVKMLCGGRGMCATCHVFVSGNSSGLTPPTEREVRTLGALAVARPNSRLACQARIIEPNVEFILPDDLYVESLSDLDALVGQRAAAPILHPVTGKVLIEKDKLIVRTVLRKLSDVAFDIENVKLK